MSQAESSKEASVADLLGAHNEQINATLKQVGDLDSGGTCIVDGLFVLRFLLVDKDNVVENIRRALQWRRANRELLLNAQQGKFPYDAEMSRHVKRGACGWLADQYAVVIVRGGHGNAAGIMRELTMEQCIQSLLFYNEYMFALVDDKTRRTGKLCKVIFIMDLQGFSLKNFDRRFAKANGDTTHIGNLYYPQLIKTIAIVNLPSTFRILYSFSKMFTSRWALETQKICPARTRGRSARDCPFLSRFGPDATSQVPHFLGGTHPLPSCLQLEGEMDET
jgi:hypothetical protein